MFVIEETGLIFMCKPRRRAPGILFVAVIAATTFAAPADTQGVSSNQKNAAQNQAAPARGVARTDMVSAAPDSMPPIDKMPEITTFVKALYPPDLIKRGVEGTVVLDLIVNDSGRVDSAAVTKGVDPLLDSAALSASRRFVFTPAMAAGKPVPVLMEYAYHFTIDEVVTGITEYVNFKGRLLERGTRAPLVNAMVVVVFPDSVADTAIKVPFQTYLKKIGGFEGQYLQAGALATATDSTGAFRFKSLPVGKIDVKVIVPDYESFSDEERIARGQATDVIYRLQRISYGDNEIVVYGKAEKKEVAQQTLTLNEVKKIPGFGGDAVKVVQALPGVARVSFFSSQIIVRGSASGDTRCYLDGIPIPTLFHFGGLKSTYNSDALASVDLYPGGFNVEYGDAVGGTIEIKGRPGKTDRLHSIIDFNLIDASVLVEGPLSPQFSLLTTFRRSYMADVLAYAIKKAHIALPMTVAPYYWDDVTRLDYHPSKNTSMFLTFFAALDELKFVFSNIRGGSTEVSSAKDEISQNHSNKTVLYGFEQTISPALQNSLRLAYMNMSSVMNFLSFYRDTRDVYGIYARDQLSYAFSPRLSLIGGLDATPNYAKGIVAALGANGAVETKATMWVSDIAMFAKADYKLFPTFSVIPGIRYDYYTDIKEGRPSVRCTARYNYIPGHTIKGSMGTYSQDPQPNGEVVDSVFGNPNMPATLGVQSVLGYEYKFSDLDNIDVQAYYNTQSNIPLRYDSLSTVTNKPVNFLPIEKGRMYGLEVLLRHNQGKHFFGWLSYSLARSERQSPVPYSQSLSKPWDPNAWYINSQDQTHNLQLIGSWRFRWGIEAGMRLRYVTGNPITPNLGYTQGKFEYNAEYGYYESLMGKPRSDRMGAFKQLDLRLEKKFTYDKWIMSLYLDVQNVNYFWYNSPETYDYNYDGSERQTIGWIFYPSLGFHAEF